MGLYIPSARVDNIPKSTCKSAVLNLKFFKQTLKNFKNKIFQTVIELPGWHISI